MYFKIQKNCHNPDALLIVKHKSSPKLNLINKNCRSIHKTNKRLQETPIIYYSNCQQQHNQKFKSPKSPSNGKIRFNTETDMSRNSTKDYNMFDFSVKSLKNQDTISRHQRKNQHICHYDRKMENENKLLRQENAYLNKYCTLISQKYEEMCKQIRKKEPSSQQKHPQLEYIKIMNENSQVSRLNRKHPYYSDSEAKTTISQNPVSPLTKLLSKHKL